MKERYWRPRFLATAAVLLVVTSVVAGYTVLVASTVNAPPRATLPSAPLVAASPRAPTGGLTSRATPSVDPRAVACGGSLAPPPRGADGLWLVAQSDLGGFVGYRASEILGFEFVRSPNEAVARTSEVSGRLTIDGSRLIDAEVTANVADLRSDIDVRDSHVLHYLDLDRHPTASFRLGSPIEIGQPALGATVKVRAPGSLAMLETSHEVAFDLEARWSGNAIDVAGQTTIKRSEYGMDVPQLLGFSVAEDITIELSLRFVRQDVACAPARSAGPTSPSAAPSSSPPSPPSAPVIAALPTRFGDLAMLGVISDSGGTLPEAGIHVLSAGGHVPKRLTDGEGGRSLDDEPAWSPDGEQIAFSRWPAEMPPDLWVMNADGSGSRRLTTGESLASPAWSNDGRSIVAVVIGETNQTLRLVDVATGATRQLVEVDGTLSSPQWSPDGRWIAFTLLENGSSSEDIYAVRPNGTDLHRLVPDDGYEYEPRWSLDGTRLAFVRDGAVWAADASGGDPRPITPSMRADSPLWSADNAAICFVIGGSEQMNAGPERRGLWFVDVDSRALSHMDLPFIAVAHPALRP